jgi:hypothetical protein
VQDLGYVFGASVTFFFGKIFFSMDAESFVIIGEGCPVVLLASMTNKVRQPR